MHAREACQRCHIEEGVGFINGQPMFEAHIAPPWVESVAPASD